MWCRNCVETRSGPRPWDLGEKNCVETGETVLSSGLSLRADPGRMDKLFCNQEGNNRALKYTTAPALPREPPDHLFIVIVPPARHALGCVTSRIMCCRQP